MSQLIKNRKAVTTAPSLIPLPLTLAATASVQMNPRRLIWLVPGSPRRRFHQPPQWCYLLALDMVTAAPARPTQHRHPLLMPRGHNNTNYNFNDINDNMLAYVNRLFAERYKQWKSNLHQYFQKFDDPQIALEEGCQKEFEDQEDNWVWLCSHFQEPSYVKAKANKINREKKTILHYLGLRPFSYRIEARGVQNSRRSMSLETLMFDLGMSWPRCEVSNPYRHLRSDSRMEARDEPRASSSSQPKDEVTALIAKVADLRTDLAFSQSSIRLPDIRPLSTSKPLQP
ncbi:hypothetical protein D8674_008364 [Pyrus ussuriensis x Pyrus communis]|uniref:Uncharacterized protein n=1 Tax=Pyrus ussuriensis x Pyrus communis TaxID=2448454 RepID=A0A5N5HSJ7_9ROSA|nr:hypothetical protein D8674_008364 [Pyrus ussuriensis x Pyrus communis]